jgi:hypothetical protein
MSYIAEPSRYDGRMPYRRTGRSGLLLPAVSLGLWQNFGGVDNFETGRAVLRRAFDRGVTHFDLANNYGPRPVRPRKTSAAGWPRISCPTAMSWSSPARPAGRCGPVPMAVPAARASTSSPAANRA